MPSGKRGNYKKLSSIPSKSNINQSGGGGGEIVPIQQSNINNMNTLWILLIIFMGCMFFYVLWLQYDLMKQSTINSKVGYNNVASSAIASVGDFDVLRDPYIPPVKVDGYVFDRRSSDIRGLPPLVAPIQTTPVVGMLPVNVETRGIPSQYSQVGILTKNEGKNDSDSKLILPLMGRRNMTGRDKWQYYTISNTGFLNTKLPIRVNGRNCSGEYGCDQMMNGDMVYVEGYDSAFRATIYENTMFSYIPAII